MNNKTDILNELKELSPFLLQVKETEKPLSVPAHYFEDFTDTIFAEIKTKRGFLETLQKEKTTVPPAYFDKFADNIISKIKEEEASVENGTIKALPKQPNKVFQLFARVAFAASVVGAMFFIKHIQNDELPLNNCADGIACLTQEEIYNYMNANSHEFDVQQIQEVVKPVVDTIETKIDIESKDATKYIEENKLILEFDDSSTDIF